MAMFGLFERPKLEARFTPAQALTDEFARTLVLAGHLIIANSGADAELVEVEMMVIAGFRRIPLEVPSEWRALRVARGSAYEGPVQWTQTLEAPLRAEAGELAVSARDQKHKKWEWRLPFAFERR
jgi:hypothetical protein